MNTSLWTYCSVSLIKMGETNALRVECRSSQTNLKLITTLQNYVFMCGINSKSGPKYQNCSFYKQHLSGRQKYMKRSMCNSQVVLLVRRKRVCTGRLYRPERDRFEPPSPPPSETPPLKCFFLSVEFILHCVSASFSYVSHM